MPPHVHHVVLQPIDHVRGTLEFGPAHSFHQPRFENDLLNLSWDSEGRDMCVVCVWTFFGGDGRVVWVAESCVSHEDDRLVGGGGVAGDGHYLLRHLVHVDLKGG